MITGHFNPTGKQMFVYSIGFTDTHIDDEGEVHYPTAGFVWGYGNSERVQYGYFPEMKVYTFDEYDEIMGERNEELACMGYVVMQFLLGNKEDGFESPAWPPHFGWKVGWDDPWLEQAFAALHKGYDEAIPPLNHIVEQIMFLDGGDNYRGYVSNISDGLMTFIRIAQWQLSKPTDDSSELTGQWVKQGSPVTFPVSRILMFEDYNGTTEPAAPTDSEEVPIL